MSDAPRATIFPPDGNWAAKEGFWEAACELAGPNTVSVAVHMLQSIFTTEWGRAMHAQELAGPSVFTHPFMEHFHHMGGIRELLELGLALAVVGSPPELTHDLTTPVRYRSRSREILAGALFRCFGAKLTFIPETGESKRPEFIAKFGGAAVAIEVKGLDWGVQERLHVVAAAMITRWLPDAQLSLPTGQSSHIRIRCGARVLRSVIRDNEVDVDAARELGCELGDACARLVLSEAAPGEHRGPRGAKLILDHLRQDTGLHHWNLYDVLPGWKSYLQRLRRRLKDAARKFSAFHLPGIIVLEPPMMLGMWRVKMVEGLALELGDTQSWNKDIAAVVLSETHFFAEDTEDTQAFERGSDLRIVQGRRWTDLPPPLQRRWSSPCGRCGRIHDRFDVVSFVNTISSPEAGSTGNDAPTES